MAGKSRCAFFFSLYLSVYMYTYIFIIYILYLYVLYIYIIYMYIIYIYIIYIVFIYYIYIYVYYIYIIYTSTCAAAAPKPDGPRGGAEIAPRLHTPPPRLTPYALCLLTYALCLMRRSALCLLTYAVCLMASVNDCADGAGWSGRSALCLLIYALCLMPYARVRQRLRGWGRVAWRRSSSSTAAAMGRSV